MRSARIVIVVLYVSLLAAWGCEHSGPVEAIDSGGGVEVTLSQIQSNIFDNKCAVPSCHVTGSAFAGLVLSEGEAYGNLVGVDSAEIPGLPRVKAGNPDSSYVVWKVEDRPGIVNNRMPLGGDPLSQSDIDAIRNWIANGAKDN